ncbi:MAG: phosphoribosyltransferase [Candidatus Nanohalobium sp.]
MSFSGKTAEQLLEQAQNAEDRDRRVQALNSTAQMLFDEAYMTGDDTRAVNFAEEVFAPEIQGLYTGRETGSDLEYWREEVSGLDRESGVFHVPATESAPYDYLRSCMEVVEEEYDQVVGVHSGGLAPVYAVEDIFEADAVVLRYSHRDRADEDVQVTPEMEERADFEGSDVLVLDDVVESGETFRQVGEYIMERGANSVDAVPVRTSMWDVSHDSEMLDLVNGGKKYGIVDYEREKDYSDEGLSLAR